MYRLSPQLLAALVTLTLCASLGTAIASVTSISFTTDLIIGDDDDELVGMIATASVDSRGHIYLADLGLRYIQELDEHGRTIQVFGDIGEGPGDLMFPFLMTIDENDLLYFAGGGGRVAVWRNDGHFVREFRRLHSGGTARSIRVSHTGLIYLGVLDIVNQTTIDAYDSAGTYLRSFGSSYASGSDVDTRTESFYGGGSVAVLPSGNVVYSQRTPYRIELYSPEGTLLNSTSTGGDGFLAPPEEPDYGKETFVVKVADSSVGVFVTPRWIVNCAVRRTPKKGLESLCVLYDHSLNFVAKSLVPDSGIVVGTDNLGRLFLFSNQGDVPTVRRSSISITQHD